MTTRVVEVEELFRVEAETDRVARKKTREQLRKNVASVQLRVIEIETDEEDY